MKYFIKKVTESYDKYLKTQKIDFLIEIIKVFKNSEKERQNVKSLSVDNLTSLNDSLLIVAKAAIKLAHERRTPIRHLTISKNIFEMVSKSIEKLPPRSLSDTLASQQLEAKYQIEKMNFLIVEVSVQKLSDKEEFLESDNQLIKSKLVKIEKFIQLLTHQYKNSSLRKKLHITDQFVEQVEDTRDEALAIKERINDFLQRHNSKLQQAVVFNDSIAYISEEITHDNAIAMPTLVPQTAESAPVLESGLGKKRPISNEEEPPKKHAKVNDIDTENLRDIAISVLSHSFFTVPKSPTIIENVQPLERMECLINAFKKIIPENSKPIYLANFAGILGNFFHYKQIPHKFPQNLRYIIANDFYKIALLLVPDHSIVITYQNAIKKSLSAQRGLFNLVESPSLVQMQGNQAKDKFLTEIEDVFEEINAIFSHDSNKFEDIITSMTDYFSKKIKGEQLLGTQSNQLMEDFLNTFNNTNENVIPTGLLR